MMRYILVILGLLACLNVEAATWYVRSPTDCTTNGCGSENGSSYDNAFDGFADAWAVAADIDAGDTVCVYGTFFGSADAQVGGGSPWMVRVLDANASGPAIVIDGDCDGDGVYAVLDGNDAVAVGIKMDTTVTMPKYITVQNLEIKNMTTAGISAFQTAATDQGVDQFHIYQNLWIHDSAIGITSRGGEITVNDSIIEDIDDDAVFHRGRNFRSDGLVTRRFSLTTTTGDGIQISGGPGNGYHVRNYTCVDTRDKKQCFIADGLTDTGAGGILEDFDFTGVTGGTVSNGAYITGVGARVSRGIVRGFNRGVDLSSDANAANVVVESVISTGATEYGFHIPVSSGTGNTFRQVTSKGASKGIYIQSTGAQTIVNSVAVGASGCGVDRVTGSAAESYSLANSNGTNFCLDGSLTSAGTGSLTSAPKFIGSSSPPTKEGFKPAADSPLRRAGKELNVGNVQDAGNRAFARPPSIGAWEVGSGDPITNNTRTTASTRTNRN